LKLKKQIADLKKQKVEERNIYNTLLQRVRAELDEFKKVKEAAEQKKRQVISKTKF
jgi:hypothetical protein